MTDARRTLGQLGGLDIDALFSAALPHTGEVGDSQKLSGRRTGPAWPSENPPRPDLRASRKPSIDAGLRATGPVGPVGPPENRGIDQAAPTHAPGSGCAEAEFRAEEAGRKVCRPALHYRLLGEANKAGGTIIGEPCDTLADLLADLKQRYGARLDLESVREAFEERAAIMEFEGGLPQDVAEQAAAAELRQQVAQDSGSFQSPPTAGG